MLLLVGCSDPSGTPSDQAPLAADPGASPPREAVDDVVLDGPRDLAAIVPFGLLRIAPDRNAGGDRLALAHGRSQGGLDLSIVAHTGENEGAVRWSADPGRLVAVQQSTGLVVEASTSGRAGIYRLTVAPGASLDLDLAWRSADESGFQTARGRQAVTGQASVGVGASLHAAIRFDHDFEIVSGASASPSLRLRFTPPGGVLHARLALSTVDLSAARANLEELPHWDLERATRAARDRWNDWLTRIDSTSDLALDARVRNDWYRVLALYGDLTDLDGRFRSADGSIRRAPAGQVRVGNLDLDRESATVIPLLALLAPEVAAALVDSLLLHQRVTDRFPVRTRWGFGVDSEESFSALPVLAALATRELPGVDDQALLPPMLKAAARSERLTGAGAVGRFGYVPFDGTDGPSVSETLEASRGQHAVAVVAARLGVRDIAASAAARSLFYRTLFDAETGWFRARDSRRRFRSPFDPEALSSAAASDYRNRDLSSALWSPGLFDVDGLLGLLGGKQELARRLDLVTSSGSSFGIGLDGGSVGDFHIPWLYAFSNRPSGADAVIASQLNREVGAQGVDAAGSAWRLFAGFGIYPVPGDTGSYVLGRTSLAEVRLRLPSESLTIRSISTKQGGEQVVGSNGVVAGSDRFEAKFDGTPLAGRTVSHRRLLRGGTLELPAYGNP